MNKKIKNIFIIISILIIIAIILVLCINILKNKPSPSQNENAVAFSEEELDQTRDEVVGAKTETSRIKTYIGQYFSYLEEKDYQKAYNMLFDNFKNNYFKRLEQFEQYVENKYPDNIVLNYTNIDREGYIYIATVEVIDGLDISNSFEQRIVVRENDVNDFNISFQMD